MPSGSRGLYLQIGANVDNLATAAKAGKSILAEFGNGAVDQIQQIEQAFQKLGAGGGFEASARNLQATFTRSLSEIKRNAQQVLDAPSPKAAFSIVNSQQASAAADAAERQAANLRLVADAAARAAQAQGEDNAALRTYAVSAEAAAVGAAANATALRRQADTLGLVSAELGVEARAANDAADGHVKLGASGLIADHVIRSFADSVAAGQSPIRAFALELPRVGEAMTLMAQNAGEAEGAMGKFAGFMGGGWGIALTAAISIASVLAQNLLEGGDAANQDAKAHDALKDAIDRLTGSQAALNHETRQGIIDDINAAAAARQHEVAARSLLQAQLQSTLQKQGAAAAGEATGLVTGIPGQGASSQGAVAADIRKQLADNQSAINQANKAILSGATKLIQRQIEGATDPRSAINQRFQDQSDALDRKFQSGGFTGKGGAAEYRRQYTALTNQRDQGLEALKPTPKTRRTPVDHTVERQANADRAYQAQLGQAQDAYARALLGLSDTAEGRLKVETEALQSGLAQRILEINDQQTAGKISAEQAARLKLLATQTEALQAEQATRKEQAALLDQAYERDRQSLASQIDLLQIDADLATTRRARLLVEQQILADQQQQRRAALQKTLADPTASADAKTTASAAIERLPTQDAAERRQLDQRSQGPIAAYRTQLQSNVGDMNDALQGVAVDGLKNVEDGLTGLLSGTETVAGAFKKMATSIIADLARIAIENEIVSALGGGFFGLKDGGTVGGFANGGLPGFAFGGQPSVSNGIIRGAGTGRSDSILALVGRKPIRVSNGEGIVNERAVKNFWPIIDAMNKGTFRGFSEGGLPVPQMATLGPSAARSLRSSSGRIGSPITFDLRGAVLTQDLLSQMNAISARHAQAAIIGGAQQAAEDRHDEAYSAIPQ